MVVDDKIESGSNRRKRLNSCRKFPLNRITGGKTRIKVDFIQILELFVLLFVVTLCCH